jgi:hypothetical protein
MGNCGGSEKAVSKQNFDSIQVPEKNNEPQNKPKPVRERSVKIEKSQSARLKETKTASKKYENEENYSDSDLPILNPKQLAAVTRIQKLVRNKSAWRVAQTEREWKVIISFKFYFLIQNRYLVI